MPFSRRRARMARRLLPSGSRRAHPDAGGREPVSGPRTEVLSLGTTAMDSAVSNTLGFDPDTDRAAPALPGDRPGAPSATLEGAAEEALVADARASLTPAQMVERKLLRLLK